MKKEIAILINDAMQTHPEERPCGVYRALVCPSCKNRKPCKDLDVIMCAVAYLIEKNVRILTLMPKIEKLLG